LFQKNNFLKLIFMKKITLLLALIAVTGIARATVYLDETFNYADGPLKNAGGWTEINVTSGTVTVGGTGFTYSNAGGEYVLSGVGKVASSAYANDPETNNYRLYRSFPAVRNTIYMSFLYKAGANQGQSQSEVLGFMNRTNNGPRVWAGRGKVTGNNNRLVSFGVTKGSTTSAHIGWDKSEYAVTDVVLIVVKHDFTTNTTSMFVNPVIGGTEPGTPDAVSSDEDATKRGNLDGLSFRHNMRNATNFSVSGIRVSSTWAEAVAKKP